VKTLTIRARLTLVYGGLLILTGMLLLGVTYLLISRRLRPEAPLGVIDTPPPADRPSSLTGPAALVRGIRDVTLETVLTQGGIALAVIGAVAIMLGWAIAGRLLQPLHRITETARRIANAPAADRGLHERIALDGPHDEIKELADTFDVMLERLDHSFDGQRRFISHASHELRTPLTLNRALLEVAMYRRDASVETRQLGETLLEINRQHERLIDGLLLLAHSERELTKRSFVDLADLVTHVAAQLPPSDVIIHAEAGEAPTIGNPVLLERLVRNLLDNAIRYNVSKDAWVRVRTHTNPDNEAVLEISNTGPTVPPYEVPALFEPFHRLETNQTTTPGAGLGLSIVQAVVRAHDGSIHAEARPEGGLIVMVALRGADPESPGDRYQA
jgi:signal transduction histidine kinase